jgi:transcriptional regulator with XRE-family HTH domain
MELKDRIKELRQINKLTQLELSRELNQIKLTDHDPRIFAQTVSYWENGRDPSVNALIKLANLFEVTVDYLLGLEKEENLFEKWMNQENIRKSIMSIVDGYIQTLVNIPKLQSSEDKSFEEHDLVFMFQQYFIAAPLKEMQELCFEYRNCTTIEEKDSLLKEIIVRRDLIDSQINAVLPNLINSDITEVLNTFVSDETRFRDELLESTSTEG